MNTMRIGPLYEASAIRGDKGAAEKYLRELAARILSDDHDKEDCTRVAAILERLAAGGRKAWAAAGFAPAHRHGESDRDLRIWTKVNDLIERGVASR